jgi:hypothetical protein
MVGFVRLEWETLSWALNSLNAFILSRLDFLGWAHSAECSCATAALADNLSIFCTVTGLPPALFGLSSSPAGWTL